MASCRFCAGMNVVKYGVRKNKSSFKQMFKCNDCDRRFTPDNGFLKMKTEPEIVHEALDLHLNKRLSLAKIQDHLYTHHNVKISKEGIRGWVTKYGQNGATAEAE